MGNVCANIYFAHKRRERDRENLASGFTAFAVANFPPQPPPTAQERRDMMTRFERERAMNFDATLAKPPPRFSRITQHPSGFMWNEATRILFEKGDEDVWEAVGYVYGEEVYELDERHREMCKKYSFAVKN